MSMPNVCCLCLTADRQRFTERAVQCFLSQTYSASWMLIYDTGDVPFDLSYEHGKLAHDAGRQIVVVYAKTAGKRPIGRLRNEAIAMSGDSTDAIAHWDSDDWSDRDRIATQLEQLAHTTTAVPGSVGFHNLLFLDARIVPFHAWEYDKRRGCHNAAVGTSLMYWRKTWERQPFDERLQIGEDEAWQKLVRVVGFNGVGTNPEYGNSRPLMIAEVHGGNTSGVYGVFDHHQPAHQPEWRRAPEFDQYCRERLYP